MSIRIIGITGRAGAGKDTVADRLVDVHGQERLAMASPIKDGLAVMLGIDRAAFDDRDRNEQVIPWLGKSPRQLAQLAGTEFGRGMVADDVWLLVAQRSMKPGTCCVLSDVRFENESVFVRRLGAEVLHIERPETASGTASEQASEAGVEMHVGDKCIRNGHTIERLLGPADRVLGLELSMVS